MNFRILASVLFCFVTNQSSSAQNASSSNDNKKFSHIEYNIGILLPFSSDGSDKENKNAEAILDYYEGLKIALSHLKKDGFNSKVYVWDIQSKDSLALESLYKSNEFQTLNLLIGPISQKHIAQISKRIKGNNMNWVSPLRSLTMPNTINSLNFFLTRLIENERFGLCCI